MSTNKILDRPRSEAAHRELSRFTRLPTPGLATAYHHLCDSPVNAVESFRFLGFTITQDLTETAQQRTFFPWQVELLQLLHEVHHLLSRFGDGADVCLPFEVLGRGKALKRLHDHSSQGDGPVIKSCELCLFGDGDYGGGLEAGSYVACLQVGVEDVREHWRQLVSTMLQGGGGDRVWAGCFTRVLFFKKPFDVSLQNNECMAFI